MDEMMLTVLGQQGDYYNQWRYDGADVDSKEYKWHLKDLKNSLMKVFLQKIH